MSEEVLVGTCDILGRRHADHAVGLDAGLHDRFCDNIASVSETACRSDAPGFTSSSEKFF